MISASAETLTALSQKQIALKVRVIWYLNAGASPTDVSDRVLDMSPVQRTLAPFLGGFGISDCTFTLRNNDGRFNRSADQSHFRLGPSRYHLTKVTIEQGIRDAEGAWEYFPVFAGRVQWVRFVRDSIEVKIVSQFTILRALPMPEEYQFGEMHLGGFPYALELNFPAVVTGFANLTAADLDDGAKDYEFVTGMERPSGWTMTGTIPQGASIGRSLEDLARSILCTAIENEAGKLTFVPEVWPRTWCGLSQGSAIFPVRFDETNAAGFEFVEGLQTTATEVVVHYQGTNMRYRRAADETYSGRISVNISCPYMTHGHTAGWAARMLYEHFKTFPLAASFTTFGWGLLIQLNDRVVFTDPENGTTYTGKVVTKYWTRQSVTLGLLVSPAEGTIFNGTFAAVDSTSWGSGTVL